jgi:hypothetical protein
MAQAIASGITVIMAVIACIVVFQISREMRSGVFNRFFNVLKVTFLFPAFGGTLATLDFALGIEPYRLVVSGGQFGNVLDVTDFVTSTLLALAFLILYVDWSREPVCGSQAQEPS